jgi:hypothetical protein
MSVPTGEPATPAANRSPSGGTRRRRPAGWVRGGVVLAAMTMVMTGFFQVVEGIAALFQRETHLADPDRLFPFDLTVWGVVHLLIGVLLVGAGLAVATARPWARLVGVVFASLSAVANFLFAPYSPAWSLTIISLDVLVIFALCNYRWDLTQA